MENQVTVQKSAELQMMEAQQQAEFALTPIGRMVRQMEAVNKMAEFYAVSDFVPMTFKGKKENCAIAVDMAIRMNMNPIMVMQNMYVVHGQPSLSSKLIIAMINNCGEFEPLRFETNGKGGEQFGYRAWTYRRSDVKHEFRLEGTWITAAMVKKEGWGAKWQSMPEQMYKYRASVFWARTNAPEITMGILSREEVDEPGFTPMNEVQEGSQKSLADIAAEAAVHGKKPAREPEVEVENPFEATAEEKAAEAERMARTYGTPAEPEQAPATKSLAEMAEEAAKGNAVVYPDGVKNKKGERSLL